MFTATAEPFCQNFSIENEEKKIFQMPDDSAKVNRLNTFAENIFSNPLKAIEILESSAKIAKSINYAQGLSVAYGLRADLFFYEMKIDSCRFLLDKAYTLVDAGNDIPSRNQVANLLNRYAAIYQRRQNYDSAVELYLKAADIFRQTGNEARAAISCYNLSGIYKYLGDTAKTFFYARETKKLTSKQNDPLLTIRGYIVVADAYNFIKEYDSAMIISRQGLALASKHNIAFAIGVFNNFMGLYFTNKALHFDSAIVHYNLALQSFDKINIPYDKALVLQNIGNAYLRQTDYKNAVKFLEQAVELSRNLKFDEILHASLKDLVEAEEKLGNTKQSFEYLKQFVKINDSIQSRNSKKKVYELEASYENRQRQSELAVQQNTIRQKNMVNYMLLGGILSLLTIGLLLYFNYRNKQKLQLRRIVDLETKQKLTAAEAVLKGEEQERSRIAKDLHDGLGGMLSGIKYSFNNMKESLAMDVEKQQAFKRNIDMLDSSISEMRRLAHNMMPEALVKFGLDTALKDFCNSINQSGALVISYQSFGMETMAIEQTTEIAVYRIVQELINNTMKYAAAKTALVQLSKTENLLSVTVEDDGIGFDISILKNSLGMGWANIQNRVEFLNGTLDVKSEKGKGTSVHIELNA